MGVNESTAKSWLKRGREKLKEILIQKGIEGKKEPNINNDGESLLSAKICGKE